MFVNFSHDCFIKSTTAKLVVLARSGVTIVSKIFFLWFGATLFLKNVDNVVPQQSHSLGKRNIPSKSSSKWCL
jgi:hypothetical protein